MPISTKYKPLLLTIVWCLIAFTIMRAENPKWEFRGAWMHTIGQSQYAKQSTQENQKYLRQQLDRLKEVGVNVLIFQVRPCADALYQSEYEPWSRYLTEGGKAPEPFWDPLQFMVDEAHARGMELHAWLNPYRVTPGPKAQPTPGSLYYKHPERFIKYPGDGKIYFDPALQENREFIVKIVDDIISRYDVDGIHFDDYFYPYPANKKQFPDDKSYAKYGKGMDRGDWRRKNVDKLIEMVHKSIKDKKPWVRFGISPFGIWRNKKTDPRGSDTNGLENYDGLYADVLLWAEKGWVDYLLPQLYWELEHKAASYLVLVDWWAQAVDPKCQLYIGQDVERTMTKPDIGDSSDPNQLDHKMRLTRELPSIDGNCWWPAYSITKNSGGVADSLAAKYQSTIALVPAYTEISDEIPDAVKGLKLEGKRLSWNAPKHHGKVSDVVKFVVYRFDFDSDEDYDDPTNIMAVTPRPEIIVDRPGIYVVTALDRVNNESNPSQRIRKK